jgi:pectinesterase
MRRRIDTIVMLVLLFGFSLRAQDVHVHVSPTSTGTTASTDDFPTIQMALDHAPDVGPRGRLYVHIAPGTYRERVWVSPLRARTTLLGTGTDPSQVVITAAQNARSSQGTFFSETVEVNGDDFQADNVTFGNMAGNTGQAVAIAVHSDRAIFKRCRFLGDQDTLFANFGRQYYLDSYIRGGVDFIFGNAAAVFDKSEIHILRPGYLTAQSRTQPTQETGFVFQHSRVTADDFGDRPFYLGRPWRAYSRVVFLDTDLPASLSPEGWSAWKRGDDPGNTYYGERNSSGAGARPKTRVPWSHQLTAEQAKPFETRQFLSGKDHWNPEREASSLP